MWEDRSALEPLELGECERILDVGCGTGELTRVLREESTAEVVGLDIDPTLLAEVTADGRVIGDAVRLPFSGGRFDLVICQAVLVNLPDVGAAVEEFMRVSRDRVAAIEPDNAAVTIRSSVATEARLARRAREAYMADLATDASLGADVSGAFRDAGLVDVESWQYAHTQTFTAPYSERALKAARRKARASRLEEAREALLGGGLSPSEYDALREEWRAMGRGVVEQMQASEYERTETVPFYVTVGRLPARRRDSAAG